MLSAIEEDRIEAAVIEAEEGTSGEILCVLAGEVSKYREVPIAYAAAVSLALPPILLALSVRPLAAFVDDLWALAQAGALERELSLALGIYAAAQIALFLITFAIVSIPAVRRRLTPRTLKSHRVAKAAHHQFVSISARAMGSETGVLIFVALDDRQVQILADAGIHDKVGDPVWNKAVAAIGTAMSAGHDPTSGIIEAVKICGAALKEHYPEREPHAHAFKARPIEV
jgi:putative membrane protein